MSLSDLQEDYLYDVHPLTLVYTLQGAWPPAKHFKWATLLKNWFNH